MRRVRDQGIKRTQGTRRPRDQGTKGPEDQGTRGSGEPEIVFSSKVIFFQGLNFFPGNLDFFPVSSQLVHEKESPSTTCVPLL